MFQNGSAHWKMHISLINSSQNVIKWHNAECHLNECLIVFCDLGERTLCIIDIRLGHNGIFLLLWANNQLISIRFHYNQQHRKQSTQFIFLWLGTKTNTRSILFWVRYVRVFCSCLCLHEHWHNVRIENNTIEICDTVWNLWTYKYGTRLLSKKASRVCATCWIGKLNTIATFRNNTYTLYNRWHPFALKCFITHIQRDTHTKRVHCTFFSLNGCIFSLLL